MKTLSVSQNKHLKKLAHNLKPIVLLGEKGLTSPVQAALNQALTDHELIKVKLGSHPKETLESIKLEICETQKAYFIQKIGFVATFYRPGTSPRIILPSN